MEDTGLTAKRPDAIRSCWHSIFNSRKERKLFDLFRPTNRCRFFSGKSFEGHKVSARDIINEKMRK